MTTKNLLRNVVVVLLLMAALGAAVVLTRRRQEIRRGAYFAGTDVLLLPEEVKKEVGEEFPVELMVETKQIGGGDPAKVDFVQARMCFGPELTLGDNPEEKIVLSENFTDLLKARAEDGCLVVAAKSERAANGLSSGLVKVATVRFGGLKPGSGAIVIDRAGTRISGYNPDKESRDMSLEVGTVGSVSYQVGKTVEDGCKWWNLGCILRRVLGR